MQSTQPAVFAVSARADDIALQLKHACSQVETRFADAGKLLAETLDVITRLIQALNRLTTVLDSDATASTTRNLLAAADGLHALPDRYVQRQAQLSRLSAAGDALRAPVEEMRRLLKYLRIFTLNVKITSGGIGTAAGDFTAFADSMIGQLDVGGGQLNEFYDQLAEIDRQIRTTLMVERNLSAQASVLVPAAPNRLAADARSVEAHHRHVAAIAASTAALAQRIQGKVGEALMGLQIGDITRQRIEHVQTGLSVLKEVGDRLALDEAMHDRLARPVLNMLADQMVDIADDFTREVSRLATSLSGLESDSHEVLKLHDVVGQSGEASGQLDDLADGIAQAVVLVRDLRAAADNADGFASSTRATVDNLIDRVATIRTVREDIQMMSTNTQLRCSRLGESGKPLAVIATELISHARQLETSANSALKHLRDLESLVSESHPASSSDQLDENLLEASARHLRTANEVVENDIQSLAGSGAGLADALAETQRKMDFGHELGGVLSATAGLLAELAGPQEPVSEDVSEPFTEVMNRVAVTYTMARERTVHANHAPLLEEPKAEAAAASDDLDDAFL